MRSGIRFFFLCVSFLCHFFFHIISFHIKLFPEICMPSSFSGFCFCTTYLFHVFVVGTKNRIKEKRKEKNKCYKFVVDELVMLHVFFGICKLIQVLGYTDVKPIIVNYSGSAFDFIVLFLCDTVMGKFSTRNFVVFPFFPSTLSLGHIFFLIFFFLQ